MSRAIGSGERRTALEIAIVLPLVVLGLRLLGFYRLMIALASLARWFPASLTEEESVYVARVRQRIRHAKRHPYYPGNCLSHSLVLWWLLHRLGIDATIRIGTRRRDGALQAHAWVEYQGLPLNAGKRVRQKYATFDYGFAPETVRSIRFTR